MTNPTVPPRLTIYSNKASLKRVLETLPINSLVVIAAELLHNLDKNDVPADMEDTAADVLDSLYLDVLNAAWSRLGESDTFLQAVNWWYQEPGANSREWWQRIQNAFEANRG